MNRPPVTGEAQSPGTASPEVLAIFGPTGVGKTALAIALAGRLAGHGRRAVAVSADALQVYAGLETLTGVATADERARLAHRLVGFVPVHETFSAGAFAERAHAEIDGLLGEGVVPIVVGGTGLYLRAALTDLELRPPPPAELRARWAAELRRRGPEDLHRELDGKAPWAAATVARSDGHRLVRLLELAELGALTPPDGPNRLWTQETRRPTRLIAVTRERDDLVARIDARVDAMVAAGAIDEVRRADAMGASPTARKALGFEQLLAGDLDETKRRTRAYARRQMTWLRKLPGVEPISLTGRDVGEVAAELLP